MTFTITLDDGSEHVAKYTTYTAILPLIKIMIKEGEDFSSFSTDTVKTTLFPRLVQGLGNADFIKDLANGLLTIFPTLPSDRVWFNDTSRLAPHGVAGLQLTEIFIIIAKCLEWVNENSTLTPIASAQVSNTPIAKSSQMIDAQIVAEGFKPSRRKKAAVQSA